MKEIKGITLSKTEIPPTVSNVAYKISGQQDAVFSLQIIDASTQTKFYNFKTKLFTTAFVSENVLSNIRIGAQGYQGNVSIPAASGGNTYKFMVFADPFFDTKIADIASSDDYLLTSSLTQEPAVTVRFSTSTEQLTDDEPDNFEGVGSFLGSTSGTSNSVSNTEVAFSQNIVDADSPVLGYKFTLPTATNASNSLSDALQPVDSDFYAAVATQTDGGATNSASMVVDSVSNLVIGMSLVSIVDSSDLEQSGSLGVLAYPTITAINTSTNTVTLSDTPTWADNKAVVFRAYGADLIRKSTGGVFEFNLTVFPTGPVGSSKIRNLGQVTVNGDVSASTSIAIDNIIGVSVGSKIIGARVNSKENANLITAVHSSGTPITVTTAQSLADNTVLSVQGSSNSALIEGTIIIKHFPIASSDIYFDIDRAFVLATLS
tara:strand:- start:50 stop:1345 length:1296 start_codon:yes stop_codon:yes gene_type:complete